MITTHWREMRREFPPMLRMAVPLALAELGWMAMGVVDIVMAGRLGAAPMGAGSLATMLFYPIAICGTGLLLGMDALAAQAFGAGKPEDARRTLANGCWLAAGLTPLVGLAILGVIPLLRAAHVQPRVFELCVPYLKALLWGLPLLLFYSAFRRYLQAVNVVKPVTFALVTANLVNLAGNWALMFGHWGAPAMGLVGSAWSTSLARGYMAAVLGATIWWHERGAGRFPWRPRWALLWRLASLGLPAALQILFEGAVFGLVTVLAARLDEVSLAAHSLAVNVVSTTYMVPLGVSSAAAVRVGQAIGAKDYDGAATRGWTAMLLSGGFMGACGLALWIAPGLIVRLYTTDRAVLATGALLLRIAAFFELFDGLQVTATGALRGLGDTHTAMLAHLVGYWVVGLPVAYVLAFPWGWGAAGIWVGLSAALILIGLILVPAWQRASRALGVNKS
ncbi:MAG: MATE family efflux transporter [Bryobacteraceae bacterium]|jgi:MATE family multidrug resistance protein